jgi:hypothetical protein
MDEADTDAPVGEDEEEAPDDESPIVIEVLPADEDG